MSMTREELNRAFHEAVALEFVDIPLQKSEIDYTFSENFIRKMDNLIAIQEDGVWRFLNVVRKRIAVIAIIILGVSISACGINQVITHLYGNVYEEMREEFYAGVTATEIAYTYGISELPEGFEANSRTGSAGHQMREYKDERGHRIHFLQDATEGVKMHIRNEQVTKTSVVIRGLDVVFFENNDLIGAMWIEDGYFMELIYYGCEDVEAVIALVESVE